MIRLTLTLKMTTAQVVETLVTVNNNSRIRDYVHPEDHTQPTFQVMIIYRLINILSLQLSLRAILTRDFAPGACSRGTFREQSSSVCTNNFMGILHSREQAPRANWANLKTLPRVYWHVQNEPGACSGSKTPRVYRALQLILTIKIIGEFYCGASYYATSRIASQYRLTFCESGET